LEGIKSPPIQFCIGVFLPPTNPHQSTPKRTSPDLFAVIGKKKSEGKGRGARGTCDRDNILLPTGGAPARETWISEPTERKQTTNPGRKDARETESPGPGRCRPVPFGRAALGTRTGWMRSPSRGVDPVVEDASGGGGGRLAWLVACGLACLAK
jgi:hypothetical protein